MAQTLAQKILQAHTDDEIRSDGQIVQLARNLAESVLDADPNCAAEKNEILWKQLAKLRKTIVDWSAIS